MANHSCVRGRQVRSTPTQQTTDRAAAFSEPEVRRWPHPVECTDTSSSRRVPLRQTDSALHYIRCALSYQNQLLADIKALLEQMAADTAPEPEGK